MASRDKIKSNLATMGAIDSQSDALYRRVSAAFGLSMCETWIYYFLTLYGSATQRQLSERMAFPPQTVNSSIKKLTNAGMVELDEAQTDRKSKKLRLSKTGREFVDVTVSRLLAAEIRATAQFGEEKTKAYVALREEYLGLLKAEFESDFLSEK